MKSPMHKEELQQRKQSSKGNIVTNCDSRMRRDATIKETSAILSRKHAYIILTPFNPTFI